MLLSSVGFIKWSNWFEIKKVGIAFFNFIAHGKY